MRKRLTAIFLALLLMTTAIINTCALTGDSQISPRLTYFSSVYSAISSTSGKITSRGDYTSVASGIDVSVTIQLQRTTSSASNSWSKVKSWSRTFSPGRGTNLVTGTYTSPSSGYYRTVTTVMALNSKGAVVEAISVNSKTLKY